MNQEFTTAIQIEDKLPYMEPPYWHHPVRQLYGATLLQFGRAANAEKTKIGWSLYGSVANREAFS